MCAHVVEGAEPLLERSQPRTLPPSAPGAIDAARVAPSAEQNEAAAGSAQARLEPWKRS